MANTSCEITWLLALFKELGVSQLKSAVMLCNNQAAMHIAANSVFHERTKYIELDCHLIREKIQAGTIKTQHVSSHENLVELFTKGHISTHLQFILSKMKVLHLFSTSNLRGDDECKDQTLNANVIDHMCCRTTTEVSSGDKEKYKGSGCSEQLQFERSYGYGIAPAGLDVGIAVASSSKYLYSTCSTRRRISTIVVKASEKDDDEAFSPFGFVTDNPSSRSAIQLPETPAEDGNVSQVLYRTEDKGKEHGSYVKFGGFRWFVRETGSAESRRGTVVFLHGAPTQSYSYRVMSQMEDAGFHCFAPDWIGFGFSDKPQSGYGFDYTEKEYHAELDKLLDVLGVKSPFSLVVQGFLVGSYGLTWALQNPGSISNLAILNSPVTASSSLPGLFQQLRIPLFGEFTCQNAIIAERFIEAGSTYVLKLEKADVYRLPYLRSSGPGFALLEATRKANFKDTSSRIAAGFSSGRWDVPVLVAWGISDKYLPQSVAEEFQKGNPTVVKLKLIEGAGHMPQEDWPEKVVNALRVFP